MKKFSMRINGIVSFYLLIAFSLAGCGGSKAPEHDQVNDIIAIQKTGNHKRLPKTKFFVIPPIGFEEVQNNGETGYKTPGNDKEAFNVTQSVPGARFATTIEGIKEDATKMGKKIVAIKSITYNGVPAIYYETLSMNKYYMAEIRIPLPDKTVAFIRGNYTKDSKPETVNAIFTAIQNTIFDNNYQVNWKADRIDELGITSNASVFQLSYIDSTTDKFCYYYTPGGKTYAGNPPYLMLFNAAKVPEGSGSGANMDKDYFPSYGMHLESAGFNVKQVNYPKNITLIGKKSREVLYEGVDALSGKSISLLLTEVNKDYSVIVMIGVTEKGDAKNIEQFRLLRQGLHSKE